MSTVKALTDVRLALREVTKLNTLALGRLGTRTVPATKRARIDHIVVLMRDLLKPRAGIDQSVTGALRTTFEPHLDALEAASRGFERRATRLWNVSDSAYMQAIAPHQALELDLTLANVFTDVAHGRLFSSGAESLHSSTMSAHSSKTAAYANAADALERAQVAHSDPGMPPLAQALTEDVIATIRNRMAPARTPARTQMVHDLRIATNTARALDAIPADVPRSNSIVALRDDAVREQAKLRELLART